MKITDDFHYKYVPTSKLTLFTVNKDEWDTKEDTGKNTLHKSGIAKGVEAMLNNETVKIIALLPSYSEGMSGRQIDS